MLIQETVVAALGTLIMLMRLLRRINLHIQINCRGDLEWELAGDEECFNEGRRVVTLGFDKLVQPFNPFLGECTKLRDGAKDPGEIVLDLLCLAVVGAVIPERVDYLHLQILHLLRILQAVAIWQQEIVIVIYQDYYSDESCDKVKYLGKEN